MRRRSPAPRLADIRDAIDGIRETVAHLDLEAYRRSWQARRAVERGVEIISEASRHLPAELIARHPDFPWRAFRAIGNQLRHEYQRVDDAIMWDIASRQLAKLDEASRRMEQSLDGDEGEQP